eukprot:3139239-Prymnesium_polylepis.1
MVAAEREVARAAVARVAAARAEAARVAAARVAAVRAAARAAARMACHRRFGRGIHTHTWLWASGSCNSSRCAVHWASRRWRK